LKVELLDYTKDAEYQIGLHASECYDSKTDRESCLKRAAKCVETSHLAVLRFAWATFRIDGISRVCSHQLVRVGHAGILQRSARYVKETHIEYIDPPTLQTLDHSYQDEWVHIQRRAENLYLKLVEAGHMKKEDARFILPQGCSTSLRVAMNFQGWIDFLNNRDSKHSQWEIRAVAQEIRRQLHSIAPNIFKESLSV